MNANQAPPIDTRIENQSRPRRSGLSAGWASSWIVQNVSWQIATKGVFHDES